MNIAVRVRPLVWILVAAVTLGVVSAQNAAPGAGGPAAVGAPQAGRGGGGGGRGRGGLPGATPAQMQAIGEMNARLAPLAAAVSKARVELATATFAPVKNDAAIAAAIESLRQAELALATKRADEFAALQAGPNRLNDAQVAALIAADGNPAAGGGGRGGGGGGRGGGRGAALAGGRGN